MNDCISSKPHRGQKFIHTYGSVMNKSKEGKEAGWDFTKPVTLKTARRSKCVKNLANKGAVIATFEELPSIWLLRHFTPYD